MTRRLTSPAFVGRGEELARLSDALARAVGGHASLVLVAGEAGVGKSRLLAEFAELEPGARVLIGGCLDMTGGGLAYAPFAEAFRRVEPLLEGPEWATILAPATPDIARLVPGWAAPSDGEARSGDPDDRRARLFESVLSVLTALAAERPLVLVIEDLQWADVSTRDLLRFLARNVAAERILLVATYRSDDLHRRHPVAPLLSELERSERVERLTIEPFGSDDVADQLGSILGELPSAELVQTMLERSDGLPFYVEELLAEADGASLALPASLREILEHRLASLTEPTLAIMRAASVLGTQFEHDRLVAALDRPDPDILDAIREATDKRILVLAVDGGPSAYRFRHSLLREAAYDQLLPLERVRLHGRLADAFAAIAAADPTHAGEAFCDLAGHAYHAHELDRALDGSFRAMHYLVAIPALPEALVHGERALELWPRVPTAVEITGTDRADLLLEVARIAANLGRLGQAASLAGEGLAELDARAGRAQDDGSARLPHDVRLLTALDEVAHYAWEAADFDTSSAALRRAEAMLAGDVPPRLLVSIVTMLGFVSWSEGRLHDSLRLHDAAMEAATAIGDRRAWAIAASVQSETRTSLGQPVTGAALADEAAQVLTHHGAADWDFYSAASREYALWMVGRFEESADQSRVGLAWATRYGLDDRHGSYFRMSYAEAIVELGRYDEVRAIARPLLSRRLETPAVVWTLQAVARAEIAQGRFDEARALLDRVRSVTGLTINGAWRLEAEIDLARAEGRFEDVASKVEETVQIGDRMRAPAIAIMCLGLGIDAAAEHVEAARLRRNAAAATAAALAARRWRGLLLGIVSRAREAGGAGPLWEAVLAMAEAQVSAIDGAPDAIVWRRVVDAWDELHRPLSAAAARIGLANAVLRSGGPRATADEALRDAHRTILQLGAKPLQRAVEDLAFRAGIDLRETLDGAMPAATATAVPLTRRERDALRLVRAGHTNKEIGSRLFISEKTASVHVSNAMSKLDALSRYEAAAAADRLGLLD